MSTTKGSFTFQLPPIRLSVSGDISVLPSANWFWKSRVTSSGTEVSVDTRREPLIFASAGYRIMDIAPMNSAVFVPTSSGKIMTSASLSELPILAAQEKVSAAASGMALPASVQEVLGVKSPAWPESAPWFRVSSLDSS